MTKQQEYCKVPVEWLEQLLKYVDLVESEQKAGAEILLIGYCSSAKTILKNFKHV